jgi:hypothetical protein
MFGPVSYGLTRLCLQRSLGFVYLIGFLIAFNQFRPLAGEHGLAPVRHFLERVDFWDAPSVFWIDASDRITASVALAGVFLAAFAVTGLSEAFGMAVSVGVWFLLWLFYLSFVNVGQVFYGFGWETLLLETGFLAIFLGARNTAPPAIVIWLFRWVLFRVMFGAGLIKLRGDPCWRDLTCMFYHYETQPLPNPLSLYFHRLPAFLQKTSVLFTHFAELVVPFGILVPGVVGYAAGAITIVFQLTLILSGNLSWLNYITIVLALSCFDDAFFKKVFSWVATTSPAMGPFRRIALGMLAALVVFLSIRPVRNLISGRQLMNASFEPLHLVNTYGAFGSVTREREEIILEGTSDAVVTEASAWKPYEFKAKPGDVTRRPAVVSPYHYKLDWQMWFAAMSSYRHHPWILVLVEKLLQGDPAILSLMGPNPFPDAPPKHIRAQLYRYRFPHSDEEGVWWVREPVGEYLPPLSLDDPDFREAVREITD